MLFIGCCMVRFKRHPQKWAMGIRTLAFVTFETSDNASNWLNLVYLLNTYVSAHETISTRDAGYVPILTEIPMMMGSDTRRVGFAMDVITRGGSGSVGNPIRLGPYLRNMIHCENCYN